MYTCSLSSPLKFLGHGVRLSGWKRNSPFRIRVLDNMDWSCTGARRNDRIDSLSIRKRMSVMDMLVRGRLPGREIGQVISWNFTFETAEAMKLVHIDVCSAQHSWTKLDPPLGEERLFVRPDCRRRQRHLLQRQFARSMYHGRCPVAVSDASADPRLRDAVVPLLSCETLPLRAFVRFPAPLFFFGVLPGFLLFPLSTLFFIFCLMVILRLSPLFIFPLETSLFLFFLVSSSSLALACSLSNRALTSLSAFRLSSRLRCAPSSLSAASCSSLCSLSKRALASLAVSACASTCVVPGPVTPGAPL